MSVVRPKVLIIKMSALGDVFMALPHMDAILSHHPNDDPWVLTGPAFTALFDEHPRIQAVALDRSRRIGGNSAWGRILWVRRQRFTSVYDLQGNRTSRLIVRFSGAPRRVGTQPHKVYTHHPDSPYTRETEQNVFGRLNDTLSSAGLASPNTGARLFVGQKDADTVTRWKQTRGVRDRRYVLMHAGSSRTWYSKRWPRDHYLKLAHRFDSMDIQPIWIGAADDREVNHSLSRQVGIDATERFGIMQLYVLGKDALLAVTNDSGPMHILAASGIPVFSFFGPTSWIRSHAFGQKCRVFFHKVACSPCFLGTCPPAYRHICMRAIDPETVFSKIRNQIDLDPRALS